MRRRRRRHERRYREDRPDDGGYERHDPYDRHRRRPRIYRSSKDVVCAGVCAGIGEHFDFSANGVRLAFVLVTLLGGFPWVPITYCILCATMKPAPQEEFTDYKQEEFWNVYTSSRSEALLKVKRTFDAMDKRLQRMESIVTSPGFGLEDELKNL